jgi:hypothetical protein
LSREVTMFGMGHSIAALDVASGPFALMFFSAAAAVVVVAVLVRLALQRAGFDGIAGVLWFGALALVGGLAAYPAFEYFTMPDQAVERRAIEARAAELTERALVPGSPLGCLDAVANALVENACEKPLFASAETVAAAVAYVDARISLLTAGAKLAERDAAYRPSYERLRRGLEADRYGIVAHVLSTRGCDVVNCPEIRLLRDSSHVVANIKAHAFEAALGVHALAWPNSTGNAAVASAPPATTPMATTGIGAPMASGGPATTGGTRFDFPSASSIPPVSIMNAEPGASDAPKPAAPKHPTAAPRRSSQREAAAPAATHAPPQPAGALPPPPPPPTQIAPPETAPEREQPDTHATH